MNGCTVAAPSRALVGHEHTCSGAHMDDLHKCADPGCRRWFAASCGCPPEEPCTVEDDYAELAREQRVEAAEDRAEQAAYDAARERS